MSKKIYRLYVKPPESITSKRLECAKQNLKIFSAYFVNSNGALLERKDGSWEVYVAGETDLPFVKSTLTNNHHFKIVDERTD